MGPEQQGLKMSGLVLLSHVVVLLVDPVIWVDVRFDGDRLPGGASHLADQKYHHGEEQGKDTGQGGIPDDYIEDGVV